MPLPVQLRERASFANYIAGRNAEAVAALRAGQDVLLAGPRGSGKSHLLLAMLRERDDAACVDGAQILALGPALLDGLAEAGWLGLDDLDAIQGDRAASVALARLLDARRAASRPTALTARLPPAHMDQLLPDLRTRLARTTVYGLLPLDEDTRREWLLARARARGLELPEHVADYLLRRLPRDAGSLIDAVERLDRAALAAKRSALSIPFVQKVLELG